MVNQIELQKQAKRAQRSRRVSVAPSGIKVPLEWGTGPFECCADCCTEMYSCCCFPCAFGAISRNLDNTSVIGLHCCAACLCPCCIACTVAPGKRARIRQAFKLPEEPCGSDCMYWSCCPCCAQCQESREFKSRGIDSYTYEKFQGHSIYPVSAAELQIDAECDCASVKGRTLWKRCRKERKS